ncbi:hypothetical protein RF679_11090 [Undibacterium cyanobacteriorum]|uniref:DUF481 domain-containing protein n=1 Tax=Undibacterium cyanobacteriorum TaxID=3073561 RepID=A0ABY9RD70_9BURK|nr:hypothetical protein [Undibacterium sp. 20NA77.5]WMW79192.1 hypothetical protein RF679_11090 [Undibacterium sp. 20NA77.5]
MKSIVLVPLLIFSGVACAQEPSAIAFSLKSPLEQYKTKQLASVTLAGSGMQLVSAENDSGSLKGRPLVIKTSALANFNFSKNDKIQYGFKLEADQFFDPFAFEKRLDAKLDHSNQNRIQTGAYLHYRFTPDYSLTASATRLNGVENGKVFSVGAKASKFFGRKHSLTANFSFNWSNTRPNIWSQFDRNLNFENGFSASKLSTRPDLRLGVTWNWEINSNWSISTGMSARHFMNDVNKNPFNTQRSSVTIFSVANYRF